jgi:beta-lactamase class D
MSLLISALLLLTPQVDFDRHFAGFSGGFSLRNQQTGHSIVHNPRRVGERLSPCSTFKIVHALIALETGVVEDETTTFKWDGVDRSPFTQWNRDHTLASSMPNSVVWFYQRTAQQIGPDRMQHYLNLIPYGNRDISGGQTNFWLHSSLKISPREQVEVLDGLTRNRLPFSSRSHRIVRNIMKLDEGPGWTLYGKTGTAGENGRVPFGWFVGWVERGGENTLFATSIKAHDGASGMKAREISRAILFDLRLIQ